MRAEGFNAGRCCCVVIPSATADSGPRSRLAGDCAQRVALPGQPRPGGQAHAAPSKGARAAARHRGFLLRLCVSACGTRPRRRRILIERESRTHWLYAVTSGTTAALSRVVGERLRRKETGHAHVHLRLMSKTQLVHTRRRYASRSQLPFVFAPDHNLCSSLHNLCVRSD